MDYKKMIEEARQSGRANEASMWASIEAVEDILEELRSDAPDKYWRFLRRAHRSLYGCHYDDQFALHDISRMHSTDAQGKEQTGAHWTKAEVVQAWAGKQFPKDTTDADKWVAANAMWHDMRKAYNDEQVLTIAWLFFFADEDYMGEGKVWQYFNC